LETAPQNWEEIMRSAHEIFEDAMYQVYGQTETLPVAMTGTRPQFGKDVPDENNKLATSDGSMRTTASGSTESTT
jgi:acyl-CoA synthetase (AMP-forming)/AMP-acid ligase II